MAEIAGNLSTERKYYMEVTWQLRDFLRRPAIVNSSLESAPFSLAESDWRLELYPNGRKKDDSEGWIDIFLRRQTFSVARQRVKFSFSLKNRVGKNCESAIYNTLYEQNENGWGVKNIISRSELKKTKHSLLPDGTLTVHCQIIVEPSPNDSVAPEESSEIDSSLERVETGASPRQHLDASLQTETPDACKGVGDLPRTSPRVQNLQTYYKKLLESKEEADVRLKVSDEKLSLLALAGILIPTPSMAHTGLHGAN